MGEVTYKVHVSKTVQVHRFGPVNTQLTVEGSCDRVELTTEYRKAYAELKSNMNEIFGKPKTDCLD